LDESDIDEDIIKADLREIRCADVEWINLVRGMKQCRVPVNKVMKFQVPLHVGNFLTNAVYLLTKDSIGSRKW
jgi:hypothetical protein